MIRDFHKQCRDAVAALIEAERTTNPNAAGLKELQKTLSMDTIDGELASGPVAVAYLMAQAQPAGGTARRDDWKIPIAVGLKSTGALSGCRAGPDPTDFLGMLADLFHNKRPAGLPSAVWLCEIDPQGMAATDEPRFQQLTTATVVVLTARINRR